MRESFKAIFGSLVLLIISYFVYALRYPIWNSRFVEPVFGVLILSSLVVLSTALLLLKKDMGKPIRAFFRLRRPFWIILGITFAFLFQALWIGLSLSFGGIVSISLDYLRAYEGYAFYNFAGAFALYFTFAVFGAFAEEVAYRGYVLPRILMKYGVAASILVSTLLFTLQHIHIFQHNWIIAFFEGQFIYVVFFGVFVAYFFLKSNCNIWAVIAFHCSMNAFNVALPIQAATPSVWTDWLRTILCFLVLIAMLRLYAKKKSLL